MVGLNIAAIIIIAGIALLIYLYIKALKNASFGTKVFVVTVLAIILIAIFAK